MKGFARQDRPNDLVTNITLDNKTNFKPVEFAYEANVALSSSTWTPGDSPAAGTRILLAGQTNPLENGVYVMAAGPVGGPDTDPGYHLVRAGDHDSMVEGKNVFVNNGENAKSIFTLVTSDSAAGYTFSKTSSSGSTGTVTQHVRATHSGDGKFSVTLDRKFSGLCLVEVYEAGRDSDLTSLPASLERVLPDVVQTVGTDGKVSVAVNFLALDFDATDHMNYYVVSHDSGSFSLPTS